MSMLRVLRGWGLCPSCGSRTWVAEGAGLHAWLCLEHGVFSLNPLASAETLALGLGRRGRRR